jgi:CMP-N-acetylneuraminic acid synthetase
LVEKPLIDHSIEYTLNCSLEERTIVSTDDPEIVEIGRHYGANVPFFHPSKFAQDTTPDYPVFDHALNGLCGN